jgi:hypothetical protein
VLVDALLVRILGIGRTSYLWLKELPITLLLRWSMERNLLSVLDLTPLPTFKKENARVRKFYRIYTSCPHSS